MKNEWRHISSCDAFNTELNREGQFSSEMETDVPQISLYQDTAVEKQISAQ